MRSLVIVFGFLLVNTTGFSQTEFFEGSWKEAFDLAKKQNKYLFIDCYTDWCGWCKVADKKTFPTKVVGDVLNENFVSVKVDMERGDGVMLGAKYRVFGYPSYIMFTPEGKLTGKMFGYKEDAEEFAKEIESILDPKNQPNYPSSITDEVEFPQFYVNSFTNKDGDEKRQNPEPEEVDKWLSNQKDLFSEASWSVMYKFPLSDANGEQFLTNRQQYADLYGEVEVSEKVSGIAYSLLQKAMKSQDGADLQLVMDFADKHIKEDVEAVKAMYRLKFSESKEDWQGYVSGVEKLIEFYGQENFTGGTNNYCWTIYLKVDDKELLNKAIGWMKKVVELDAQYMYLDTYAALLYKVGDYGNASEWAIKAISVGMENGEKVQDTEDLLVKIKAASEKN